MLIFNKLCIYNIIIKNSIVNTHRYYKNNINKNDNDTINPTCNTINTNPVGFCLERYYSHKEFTEEYIRNVLEHLNNDEYKKWEKANVNKVYMSIDDYEFILGPWKCIFGENTISVYLEHNHRVNCKNETDCYDICFERSLDIDKDTWRKIHKLSYYVYRFNNICTLTVYVKRSKITRQIVFYNRKDNISKYCYYDANWNLMYMEIFQDTNYSIPTIKIKYTPEKTIIKLIHFEKISNTYNNVYFEKSN